MKWVTQVYCRTYANLYFNFSDEFQSTDGVPPVRPVCHQSTHDSRAGECLRSVRPPRTETSLF